MARKENFMKQPHCTCACRVGEKSGNSYEPKRMSWTKYQTHSEAVTE